MARNSSHVEKIYIHACEIVERGWKFSLLAWEMWEKVEVVEITPMKFQQER